QVGDVRLRPARPEEIEAVRKGELLPPVAQAAARRFAKVSIPADTALRREYLEDLSAPADLRARLSPGTVAVNLALPKQHCAGGLIATGDWVNVQLMTAVEGPAEPTPFHNSHTAAAQAV